MNDLPLKSVTPAKWVEAVAGDLDAALGDHAHCELKAASTAMALVGRFAWKPSVARDLTALAREELKHFDQVRRLLEKRKKPLPPVAVDRYAKRLAMAPLKGLAGSTALMDKLVICAFIEARSCERFRMLAEAGVLPAALRGFYADLADAEGRHHELFLELATEEGPEAVEARVREVAVIEARIVAELPVEARIH
jgi:tRNA-(ms[2]io[6]A)-hydroxylase